MRCQSLFVCHIACDGRAPCDFAPLFKAAVRVELKATLRTFLFKCFFHNYFVLGLFPFPTSFRSELFAATLAVGHGDDLTNPCAPPLLTATFVRCTAFVLERVMRLHRLVKAELTFQIVEHCHQLYKSLPNADRSTAESLAVATAE